MEKLYAYMNLSGLKFGVLAHFAPLSTITVKPVPPLTQVVVAVVKARIAARQIPNQFQPFQQKAIQTGIPELEVAAHSQLTRSQLL
ncbi:hypothetical protein FHG64_08010 [Antarcticibacterium flavum]|uniref:Uncharacterized protein n=1 Tax=Antarcticibacterium flavum TaxID=2058175 RepID=A0A5B7X3R2_9FLAO|nr:hypothetical protein [Antarcticibacterium flavum]QCY69341.1 hypothetical protein FHG64_08010 [Antarcticibacterium flavum]